MRSFSHQPYSPGFALCDFYLFRKLKGALARQEFDSTEQFLLAIREVTESIGRTERESAREGRERRLSEWIEMKGEHMTDMRKNNRTLHSRAETPRLTTPFKSLPFSHYRSRLSDRLTLSVHGLIQNDGNDWKTHK
jgi:hypothetical protein